MNIKNRMIVSIVILLLALNIIDARIKYANLLNARIAFTNTDAIMVTGYNPVKEQCDDLPLITASGDSVCSKTFAVARNMIRGRYHFGDTVYVTIPFIVKDLMHRRFSNHGDILFWERKNAILFGKRELWISLISKDQIKIKHKGRKW